jgi:predicted transposase YdaD
LLDLSAPEMVKDSFIDEELRQHFSDLLYRVNLKRGGDALVCVPSVSRRSREKSAYSRRIFPINRDLW